MPEKAIQLQKFKSGTAAKLLKKKSTHTINLNTMQENQLYSSPYFNYGNRLFDR